MTLSVHTAHISYAGPDRLDVTRKSGGRDGRPFAPSWDILKPALYLRREHGAAAFEAHWPRYVLDYTNEMRLSYRLNRAAWDALLARESVTLLCYCTDPMHCHRTVLAEILGKLGAVVKGERPAVSPPPERVLRLMLDAADHNQMAEEAEQELRADGVDVDAFVASVHDAIAKAKDGVS